MMNLAEVETLQENAFALLDKGRGDRITPKTAESHTDEWHAEALGYVLAELARDNVEGAKKIVERWLRIASINQRVPHMIVDKSSKRRMLLDRHIVQAERIDTDDGFEYVTPLWGLPINSIMAEFVAERLPHEERTVWLKQTLPALFQAQLALYSQRTLDSGLPIQISPDEVLLRHGYGSEVALSELPDSRLTDLERAVSKIKLIQHGIKRFRHAQANDGTGEESAYDSDDFMTISTAARHYTLARTLRKNGHALSRLLKSKGRGGDPDAFLVHDVAISGLLVADNEALLRLSKQAQLDVPARLLNFMHATRDDFTEKHETDNQGLAHINQQSGNFMHTGIEQVIALAAGSRLPPELVRHTLALLEDDDWKSNFGIPTYPLMSERSASLIDRGATNSYFNLLAMLSIEKLQIEESSPIVEKLGERILNAASRGMSREHNSATGEPLGQSNWRPTAAAAAHIATKYLS